MNAVPVVAIVGRPNVGKSSLFNWLVRKRISIVDPVAGITRDRVLRRFEIAGRAFDLVDTGGMGVVDKDGLTDEVEHQIKQGVDQADLLLFVVDAIDGLVAFDEQILQRMRKTGRPIIGIVNKCDNQRLERNAASEFARLGLPLFYVSANHNNGRDEIEQAILETLPEDQFAHSRGRADPSNLDEIMKIAIVGKRNAGKSTFVNTLAGFDRMIVSEVAGTTRDSVDVQFTQDGETFIAIDTAGVRRKRAMNENVDYYGYIRAIESIKRASVVLFMIDANEPVSNVDKHLVHEIVNLHKPVIFVLNKWDIVEVRKKHLFREYMQDVYPSLNYVPIIFISAQNPTQVQTVIRLARKLYRQGMRRLTTAEVNKLVKEATKNHPPPTRNNRIAKLYYATQADINPPTIVLFCNDPKLIAADYKAFLTNRLRKSSPFQQIPINLEFRRRGDHAGLGQTPRQDQAGDVIIDTSDQAKQKAQSANPPRPQIAIPSDDAEMDFADDDLLDFDADDDDDLLDTDESIMPAEDDDELPE